MALLQQAGSRSSPAMARASGATPMLRQYRALKSRFPGALLWFRLGDFYEMFEQDAEVAASLLNITLTSREVGKGRRLPMCGVPYHAAEAYLAQLVEAGYRVAICEQLEDPRQARGVVRRDVVRVVTPGTLLEGRQAQLRERRYLAALYPDSQGAGLAFVDLGTGEFRTTWLADLASACEELERLQPSECLVPAGALARQPELKERITRRTGALVTAWDGGAWEPSAARSALLQHFRLASLAAFGLEDRPQVQAACGAALRYLQETQREGALAHLSPPTAYRLEDGLVVDAASALNLELTSSLRQRTRRGSLLAVLDETLTGPGGRLLRRYLEEPLTDVAAINARLDAVQGLVEASLLRGRLRGLLKGLPDVQRLLARAGCGRAGPRDLVGVRAFIERASELLALLAQEAAGGPLQALVATEQPLPTGLARELASALVEQPPAQLADGGVIRPGYDPELDRLRKDADSGRAWIAGLEARERQRTGIRSLKVGYNRVFGYYIEVTRPNLHLVSTDYERRQTLTGAERFVTPELKEWEVRVLGAEEQARAREQALFEALVARVLEQAASLGEAALALARLDVAAALAEVAARRGWVRPVLEQGPVLGIRGGRHPVVEAACGEGAFVPNDLVLDAGRRVALVTGPNMGGKSTFLRQAALIVLLAQMGSFVPARSARVGIVDRILTRVGASDDLVSGRSTFLVEMEETAYILRHATPRSLVILDEVGRGTATYDGLSLAWAIVEHLHALQARALVATHFHELTQLEGMLPGVFNLHVTAEQQDGRLIFLREVRPGPADRSYGIEVARLAGLPPPVVERAQGILAALERQAGARPPQAAGPAEPCEPAPPALLRRFRPRARPGRSAPRAGTQAALFGG